MEAKIEEINTRAAALLRENRITESLKAQDFQTPNRLTVVPEEGNVPATAENLRKVDAAVKAMEIYSDHHPQTRFQYRTDQDTGRIQVALVNYMTGEVVEEIPSKKLLQFSHQLEEMVGLVMEKHA